MRGPFSPAAPSGVDVVGLAYLLVVVLVGALLPLGVLAGAVWFARSAYPSGHGAASLLALVFIATSVLATLAMIGPSTESVFIGLAAAAAVGLCGLALTIVVSSPADNPRVAVIARRTAAIVVVSLLLGGVGLILFPLLDAQVRQIAIYQGVGPGNRDTFEMWLRSRNQLPLAVSFLAAALGAIAWRATGRVSAAFATTLGSVAIGLNLLQLLLQSTGD